MAEFQDKKPCCYFKAIIFKAALSQASILILNFLAEISLIHLRLGSALKNDLSYDQFIFKNKAILSQNDFVFKS